MDSEPSATSGVERHAGGQFDHDRIVPAKTCSSDSWEEAYARFETPQEEIRKFTKRLTSIGIARWPRDARIVELFCGRGNGLYALQNLGFTRLEGVDLSASLLAQYTGPARLYLWDCRHLYFGDRSKDIVIVQGGLHHLQTLPKDLDQTLSEVNRVLSHDGLFVVVEPWLTPFLRFVHAVCRNRIARGLSPKIEALATMIRHEQETYDQWLGQAPAILSLLDKYFRAEQRSIAWGKLSFVGRKRPGMVI